MEEEMFGTLSQLEMEDEPHCPQCESTDIEEADEEHYKCNACGCVWRKS